LSTHIQVPSFEFAPVVPENKQVNIIASFEKIWLGHKQLQAHILPNSHTIHISSCKRQPFTFCMKKTHIFKAKLVHRGCKTMTLRETSVSDNKNLVRG